MKILGLHFGHDAGVALVDDGQLVAVLERERVSRRKHALGLRSEDVRLLLDETGTDPAQIDCCTVTSTQHVELVFYDPDGLSVSYGPCSGETFNSWIHDRMPERRQTFLSKQHYLLRHVFDSGTHPYLAYMPAEDKQQFPRAEKLGNIEDFLWVEQWGRFRKLDEIAAADYSGVFHTDATRLGFHYPVTIRLFGRNLPGCVVSHHFAHAAYAFFQSGFGEAAVLTHDGNAPVGCLNGMFYYGSGERLWAVSPHYLAAGMLYDQVAENMGFTSGGPGKLMGLSSYGEPRFFTRTFCGNVHGVAAFRDEQVVARPWLEHCLAEAHRRGYDLQPFGNASRATAPINVDIAASTQLLFEECLLRAVDALSHTLRKSGRPTGNLCLSGGTALNCPANSRIAGEGPFSGVCIPPGCGDSGLAAGSALAVYHNVLGHARKQRGSGPDVYLGLPRNLVDGRRIPASRLDRLEVQVLTNPAKEAAEALAKNLVIGWYEGRGELGPRALGHRSILANPLYAENWDRVNRIKGREPWRPFAPIVIEEDAQQWFSGAPLPSPYMLFTARVLSRRIPAVTHVDGSARIQTVSRQDGLIYEVVREFRRITGVPVLLNTSFNGPGEPIVETPNDALRFLLGSGLDAVYLQGRRYTPRQMRAPQPGSHCAVDSPAIAG